MIEAKNLPRMDTLMQGGSADPYCVVEFGQDQKYVACIRRDSLVSTVLFFYDSCLSLFMSFVQTCCSQIPHANCEAQPQSLVEWNL